MRLLQIVGNGTIQVCVCAIFSGITACAQFPQSMAEFSWIDQWGDRGAGVLSRDYQMCTELVEQRRGLLVGCMEARG